MRTPFLRRPWLAALPALLLALAACDSAPDLASTGDLDRQPVLTSAVTVEPVSGKEGVFAWLQPLVNGTPGGPLFPGLAPEITICAASAPTECTGPFVATEVDGAYAVNWTTQRDWATETFSITATLGGEDLGRLIVGLGQGGITNAGRTIPIRFWIGASHEAYAACVGDDRCSFDFVDPNETTVIETFDEDGRRMAVLTLPAGSAGEPLQIVLDCRDDDYDPGVGPLPTSLRQWPLFCRVDATDQNGNEFTGSLLSAATIEICVIDEDFDPDYHSDLHHDQMVLGKSPSGLDDEVFEYLPFAPTPNLLTCQGLQLTADAGLLGAFGEAVDGLGRWLGPQPLNASSMRRDGGVGGTLTAFSDINPVEPAYIDASATGFGGTPLANVSITVTDGAGFTDTKSTDGNGAAQFMVPAGSNGTDYTVAVDPNTLPSGELLASPSQNVFVDGSGNFPADFVTQGEIVISDFGATYDWSIPNVGSGSSSAPFFSPTGYPHSTCSVLNALVVGTGYGSNVWPLNTTVTLTRSIDVPAGTTRLEILGWVDNDAQVLVGNANITASAGTPDGAGFVKHDGCANLNPLTFEAYIGDFTPGAANTFTFIVRDRGVIGYADFKVTAVAGS